MRVELNEKNFGLERELSISALILFSIPSIFSIILAPIAGMVDTILVGRLSSNYLAALGIAVTIFNSFTWVLNFLIHTSTQRVAFFKSKGDKGEVASSIKASLILSLALGLIASFFIYTLRHYIYSFFKIEASFFKELEAYFIPCALGHFLLIFFSSLISIFRGLSRVKEALFIIIIGVTLNIFFSAFFLYYLKWGMRGVAYGTIISNLSGVLLSLTLFSREDLSWTQIINSKIKKSTWISFFNYSLGLFIRSFFLTLCFLLATKLASFFGKTALASHQILMQVWLLPSFLIDGPAITATIKSSELFAKKKYYYLKILIERLLIIGISIGALFSISYWFFESTIQGLFVKDVTIINFLKNIWWIMILGQVISAPAYIYDGILFGLGEFKNLAKMMSIGFVVFYFPCLLLAYYKNDFSYVWVGLTLLALFRTITGYFLTSKKIGSRV